VSVPVVAGDAGSELWCSEGIGVPEQIGLVERRARRGDGGGRRPGRWLADFEAKDVMPGIRSLAGGPDDLHDPEG